ncbi:MAG: Asp23/Gls24 family envelope stress response protein [Defluviitaleaceae bacterium]|nr:Asp23/Gls24 family envelope stress response protein [Defluviitaleaceae bacterium]
MHDVSVNAQNGQIQIANEVLAVVSGTAALEVEGVATSHSVSDASGRFAKRNFSRGVKIAMREDSVSVDIAIIVKFGHQIHIVSEEVQKRVKSALETMVGMTVKEVNVNVVGIHFDKPPKVKAKVKSKVMPTKRG